MGVLNYTHYTALRLILSSLLDTTSLNPDDAINNMTTILGREGEKVEEPENTIEYISRGLSYYWMEVIFISLVTAIMMNVLITRPIIHQMRDNFQVGRKKFRIIELHVCFNYNLCIRISCDTVLN